MIEQELTSDYRLLEPTLADASYGALSESSIRVWMFGPDIWPEDI